MPKKRYTSAHEAALLGLREYRRFRAERKDAIRAEQAEQLRTMLRDMDLTLSRKANDAIALGVTKKDVQRELGMGNWAAFSEFLRLTDPEFADPTVASDWTLRPEYATPFRGRMWQSDWFATIYLTLTHCYQWSGVLTVEYDANGARKGSPRLRDRLEWRNAFPSANPKPSTDARLTPEEIEAFWDAALPNVPDARRAEIATDLEEWAFTVACGDWEGFR